MATSPVERRPFSDDPTPKYGVATTASGKRARVGLVRMLAVIAVTAMAVALGPQPAAASELAVSVNPQDLVVTEGETASYEVVLTRAPTPGQLVIVAPVSSDEGAVTVSPNFLTFDDAYWWRPQTVTVTGVADVDKSNESVRITNQVTGSGLTMAPPVDVIVLDTPSTAPTTPSTPSTAPTNLLLTARDDQIRVRWEEPSTPAGGPVTRYEVQWRPAGAGDEDWRGVSLANTVHTAYVISWLDNETKYEVRVRAASNLGLGSWAEATVTTPRAGDQSPVHQDRYLDLDGTDKPRPRPTPTPASAPAEKPPGQSASAQEPPGKEDFKTCVGSRDCNNQSSPYYWKVNPNSWK